MFNHRQLPLACASMRVSNPVEGIRSRLPPMLSSIIMPLSVLLLPFAVAAERDPASARAFAPSAASQDVFSSIVTAPGPLNLQQMKAQHSDALSSLLSGMNADKSAAASFLEPDESDSVLGKQMDIESMLSTAISAAPKVRTHTDSEAASDPSVDTSEAARADLALPQEYVHAAAPTSAVSDEGLDSDLVSDDEKVAALLRVAEVAEKKAAFAEASLAQMEESHPDSPDRGVLQQHVQQLTSVARIARSKAQATQQSSAEKAEQQQRQQRQPAPDQVEESDSLSQVTASALSRLHAAAHPSQPQPAPAPSGSAALQPRDIRQHIQNLQPQIPPLLEELAVKNTVAALVEPPIGGTSRRRGTAPEPEPQPGPGVVEDNSGTSEDTTAPASAGEASEVTPTDKGTPAEVEQEHASGPKPAAGGKKLNGTVTVPLTKQVLPEGNSTVSREERVHEQRLKVALENKTHIASKATQALDAEDETLREMAIAAEDVAEEKVMIAMEMAKLEIQQHKQQADLRLKKVQEHALTTIRNVKPAPLPEIHPECLDPEVENSTAEATLARDHVTKLVTQLEAALLQLALMEARVASEQGKVSFQKARELTKQVEDEASNEVETYMHTFSRKLEKTQVTIHEELNRTMMTMNKRMGCDRGNPLEYAGYWHGKIVIDDVPREFMFTITPNDEGESGTVTWSAPDLYDAERSLHYTVCDCGQIEMKVKNADELLIGKLVSPDKLVWSDHTIWERRSTEEVSESAAAIAPKKTGAASRWCGPNYALQGLAYVAAVAIFPLALSGP